MTAAARVVVTGFGTVNAIARDARGFETALRTGTDGFAAIANDDGTPAMIGAPIRDFSWEDELSRYAASLPECRSRARKILRNNARSVGLSVVGAFEALHGAGFRAGSEAFERAGIVVAGSNLHQRYVWDNARRLAQGDGRVNPRYALAYLDSSQVGCLGEIFGLHGMGYSVGGASASGSLALFQAWQWLRCGVLDACLVVGAASELSPLELQAFSVLGALGGRGYEDRPGKACRPFDRGHAGFVPGEGSGAMLLETRERATARGAPILGEILGASVVMDGNHLANANVEGEAAAMRQAISAAELDPSAIGYVNAHATSTPAGDATECAAIKAVFGAHAGKIRVNATKSLTGHCLSAAGVIETIASLLQLNGGFVHPNRNLEDPIDDGIRFVGTESEEYRCETVLKNGFGFGGFNASIVLGREEG